MKKIFFYFFVFIPMSIYAQTLLPTEPVFQEGYNPISISAYHDIEIAGVSLQQIQNFNGEVTGFSQMFGQTFNLISPDPEAKDFQNSQMRFSYGNATSDMELYSFVINSSTTTVKILNKNVHKGDHISALGLGSNLKTLPYSQGRRVVIFRNNYESSSIGFIYNPDTLLITEIYYVSST